MSQAIQTVAVEDLLPGMIIREVIEFSFDYATLDPQAVQFLKTNFKGAKVVVIRDAGQQTISVDELESFENLHSIVEIPESLKIAAVVPGLARSMAQRGFLKFKVTPAPEGSAAPPEEFPEEAPATVSAKSDEAHRERVEAVKTFLDRVEVADESRERSSTKVAEMLDQGRGGKYTTKVAAEAVEEILKQGAASAMQAVAGLKGSDQTYAHCVDMSVIFQEAYADILHRRGREASEETNRFTLISGFMHDIGKSEVPKDILESTVRFAPDSKEMLLLRNHTTYGAKILSDLGMNKAVINVSHFHHVKADTTLFTSYPDVSYDEVLPLTRLASVVDVYQALIGKRKYKRNWVPGKAIEYLIKLKGSEFEDAMLDQFVHAVGLYPLGSLLRLSDNNLAFVVHIAPDEDPRRPVVAVVENDKGELLPHHQLLDLMMEPGISVTEVVDHYEHYSETEEQAYEVFRSISLD